MNDKTFVPSGPSVLAFMEAVNGGRGELDAWLEVNNEAEIRAYIRAYAAEVARACVPEERTMSTFSSVACSHVWEDCRAATLSAIDEWENRNG